MFAFKTIFASAFLAAIASAGLVPRHSAPPGWEQDILEPYLDYHIRYLALKCYTQHGQAFFDECCRPHLNWQKLEDFPAQCTPSPEASSSAAAAEKTHGNEPFDTVVVTVSSTMGAEPTDSPEEDDCDDEEDDGEVSTPEPTPAPVPAPASISEPAFTPAPAPTEEPKSSEAPKEEPTSTPAPKAEEQTSTSTPTPTAEEKPKETPKETPAPAPSNDNGNNNNGGGVGSVVDFILGGFATFYVQNGVAGACGDVHLDSDLIVAMDSRRYGNTGVKSELCGKKVEIINTNNGKSVVASIEDACPTCENENSIDLSKGTFEKIAEFDEGIVPIKWQFV